MKISKINIIIILSLIGWVLVILFAVDYHKDVVNAVETIEDDAINYVNTNCEKRGYYDTGYSISINISDLDTT
jgi:hypothetical protein